MMHRYPAPHTHGFTLVETLVAVTLLLLVIVGPMTVAQKGVQNAYYANEQVTAVFLAQEAVEAMRRYRDQRGLQVYASGSGETSTWMPSGCGGSGCAYDPGTGQFESCAANNSCRLRLTSEGKYEHDIGTNSPFTRRVVIEDAVSGGVPVTVTVSWTSNVLGARSVVLQTWIYDQYRRYEE